MKEIIDKVVFNENMITLYSTALIGLMGYIIAQLASLKKKSEIDLIEQSNRLDSLKRGSLRNEYLSIVNSPTFTDEQKYGLTRDIVRDYKKLNGNHYISTLDKELEEKANEVKQ